MRRLSRPVPWSRFVSALEAAKQETWSAFSGRYGDWGPGAALWLGRRLGRLSLAQLGRRRKPGLRRGGAAREPPGQAAATRPQTATPTSQA